MIIISNIRYKLVITSNIRSNTKNINKLFTIIREKQTIKPDTLLYDMYMYTCIFMYYYNIINTMSMIVCNNKLLMKHNNIIGCPVNSITKYINSGGITVSKQYLYTIH